MFDIVESSIVDVSKIKNDYMVTISWQQDYGVHPRQLMEMIERRLEFWLKIRWWIYHFEKPLSENALRNHGIIKQFEKQRRTVKDYLHNRTLLRPRDYVIYFKLLSEYSDGRLNEFERAYSEFLLDELFDEMWWNIYNTDVCKRIIRTLCQHKWWEFKSDDFIKEYKESSVKGNGEEELKKLYGYWVIWYIEYSDRFPDKKFIHFSYREGDTKEFHLGDCILQYGLHKALVKN